MKNIKIKIVTITITILTISLIVFGIINSNNNKKTQSTQKQPQSQQSSKMPLSKTKKESSKQIASSSLTQPSSQSASTQSSLSSSSEKAPIKSTVVEPTAASSITGLSAYSTRESGSDNSFVYDVSIENPNSDKISISWYKPSAGYGYVSKGHVSGILTINLNSKGIITNISAINTSVPDDETGCQWDFGTWYGFDPILNIHIGDNIIGTKSWVTVSQGRVNSGSTIGSADIIGTITSVN